MLISGSLSYNELIVQSNERLLTGELSDLEEALCTWNTDHHCMKGIAMQSNIKYKTNNNEKYTQTFGRKLGGKK